MTLKEVAQRANVSVSTASKALKNSFDVAEETREQVLRAAHELGYFDQKKRIHIENHSPDGWRIAVMCPEVISPFYSEEVEAICAAAAEHGCHIVIYNTGFDKETFRQLMRECIDDPHINAILALNSYSEKDLPDSLPIVLFSEQTVSRCSCITTDLRAALQQIRQKYPKNTTVAIAGEKLTASRQREIQAILPGISVVGCGRYEEAGRDAAEQLLRMPALPALVICTYDEIAYGLIACLTEHGVAIPDEVQVIAINDSYASRWVHGGVSAVAFDYGNLFAEVIRDMVSDLQQNCVTPRRYRVTTRFIERNTTK